MRSRLALVAALVVAAVAVPCLIYLPTALSPERQRQLTLATALLGAVVGTILIVNLRREIRERPPTSAELLAEFERAYYSGEIDREEFEKIRSRLDPSSRRQATVPGPVPPVAEPPGAEPPPPPPGA